MIWELECLLCARFLSLTNYIIDPITLKYHSVSLSANINRLHHSQNSVGIFQKKLKIRYCFIISLEVILNKKELEVPWRIKCLYNIK